MGQKWDSRYLSKKSDTLKCMLMQHKEFKGMFFAKNNEDDKSDCIHEIGTFLEH